MIWWQRLRWLLWDVAFRCVFLCCIHVKLLLWLPFLSCCNDILSLFASLLYSSFWLWNDLYPVISVCTWYIWRLMELQLQLLMQRRWHRLAVSIPLFVSSRKRSDFCPQINSNSRCRILIWCSPVNDPGCKGLFRNCRSFSYSAMRAESKLVALKISLFLWNLHCKWRYEIEYVRAAASTHPDEQNEYYFNQILTPCVE